MNNVNDFFDNLGYQDGLLLQNANNQDLIRIAD